MVVRANNQKGISLFVTISALLILSVLTISITAQLMAPTFAATSATRQLLRENNFRSALQILQPVVRRATIGSTPRQEGLPKLDGTPFEIQINDQVQSFILQDVNGLIDINSANQNLIAAFLTGLNRASSLDAILQKRAENPFKSVEEFGQFLALPSRLALHALATVNAGRRRINSHTAPLALLQMLTGQRGARPQLISQIDRRFFRVRPITNVLVLRNPNIQPASSF